MSHIIDVAAKAGVSVATVSRVINQNPNVKPRLRQQVLKAIAELEYRPSGIARHMRNQSVQVIGLMISDIQNPFFTALVRAVEDVANSNHYTVLLCNSDEDPRKEQLYINVLSTERVAGVIIVPTRDSCCNLLTKLGIPIVMVDRTVPGLKADSVTLDNCFGTYEATTHLIQLGHRRIGLVGAPCNVSVGLERRQGYVQALAKHGIPLDEDLIKNGDFKEAGGFLAAKELLSLDPRPTALFAVNNLMTIGSLKAINEFHLRIPADISVIGLDDMPWLDLLNPPLTSVRQPTYQIGVEAAQLLFSRLRKDHLNPVENIVLKPELIIRGSTAIISP